MVFLLAGLDGDLEHPPVALLFSVPHLVAMLLAGGLFVGWAQLAAAQASATAMQAAWQGEISTRFTLTSDAFWMVPLT